MPTAISAKAAARKVKASAPKGLTVAKATAEAGWIARRIMPGVLVTVDSRGSWDMATDTQTVITTVTFPNDYDANGYELYDALKGLVGVRSIRVGSASYVITRRVN